MRKPTPWIIPVLFALAPAALAQSTSNITQESVEITPFVGIRTGGSLSGELDGTARDLEIEGGTSYGGILDFNLHKNNFKLEVLYSRQSTKIDQAGLLVPGGLDLNVEYLQGGVLQEVGNEKSRYYLAVLAGATRFAPRGLDSEMKFSLSLGGGLKFFLARNVGLRFDARAYLTFLKSDTGAFCVNGTCLFAYSGSHLWQGDFTGGLILAF